MSIIGLIMENLNEHRDMFIINNSDRKFKIFLDGQYICVINCNSKMKISLSCGSHVVNFYEMMPIKLLKFATVTFVYSIENLITQGCGDLLEDIDSLIIKYDISIDIDINDDVTLIVKNDLNVVSQNIRPTLKYNQYVKK